MVKVLDVGLGGFVASEKVVGVVAPNSSPMKRLRDQAADSGKLVDATQGRKTRSIVVTDSGHIFLSSAQPETLKHRLLVGGKE